MKYIVVYICDTLKDQIISNPLDLNNAFELATSLTADQILQKRDLDQESYIVQPHLHEQYIKKYQ